MTDRFEDAVRDAIRGSRSTPGDLPTYHDAWNRGRRRRLIKRSALAAAGAVVLIAALTVNLGRIPGTGPTEVDDVATGAAPATVVFEPTPLATTAPIETPAALPPATLPGGQDGDESTGLTNDGSTPTGTSEPATAPTEAPNAASTVVPQTVVPQTVVAPTVVPPTAVPQTVVPPTAVPPTSVPATPIPTPPPSVGAAPTAESTTDPDSAAGTASQPGDDGSPDGPPIAPQLAFTTGAPVDAVLLADAARGVALPCDLDNDGLADATCELLAEYACTGNGDVQPGYSVVDTNGDQVGDTCIALDLTMCDTNNDGQGDTPCIIELG